MKKFGDTEIARQTEAADGSCSKIHQVTNLPYKHEVPWILRSLIIDMEQQIRHQVTEMDRVNTVDAQGGSHRCIRLRSKIEKGKGYSNYGITIRFIRLKMQNIILLWQNPSFS